MHAGVGRTPGNRSSRLSSISARDSHLIKRHWDGGHSPFRLLPSLVIYSPEDASEPKGGRQCLSSEAEELEDQRKE